MRSVSIRQLDMKQATIPLGFEGENEFTEVRIDCKKTFDQHPDAVPSMTVTDPAGNKYPAVVTRDGDIVVWQLTAGDLTTKGYGEIQIEFLIDGTVIGKTDIARTRIERSIFPEGEAPEPVQNWLDEANQTLAEVEEAKKAFPAGGTTGQVLTKKSDEDYDTEWKTPQGGGGGTSNYNDLDNKPSINGVTLSGNKSLSDLSIPSQEDVDAKYTKPQGGIPASDIDPSAIPSPTSIIDDNAGEGDTNKVLSADKVIEITDGLSEAIENDLPETKSTNASDGVFDIADPTGNVVARFVNGYIKTQKFDSTNPFELPSYYPDYLDTKCERIKALMESAGGNGDAFIFITDQHMDNNCAKNAHQSFKLIKYIADKCRINKLFMGGDLINGGSETLADEFRQAIGGRMYAMCGNHEYLSDGKDKDLAYWYTAKTEDEIGNPDRRYFYVDNPKNMVRYIVLNSYAESTGQGGASAGFEQDQLDWLVDAMDVETGWAIVILTHSFYAVPDMTSPEMTITQTKQAVLDLIDTNATGHDVFIIQGHTHVDGVKTSTGGIPILITTSDKWAKADGSDQYEPWLHARTVGTITEQAFDVCILDKDQRKITAVRIGAFSSGSDETDATLTEAGERVISLT